MPLSYSAGSGSPVYGFFFLQPSHLQDELARVFVAVFDAKHLLYQLLWNMFSKEVSHLIIICVVLCCVV